MECNERDAFETSQAAIYEEINGKHREQKLRRMNEKKPGAQHNGDLLPSGRKAENLDG